MKKLFKKIVSLALVSVVAISASLTATAASKKNIYTEPGTYPIVNEPITMSMFMRLQGNILDVKTNGFTKYMEELTNIHWEFEQASSDAVTEKINLLMASNDMPDVFMFDIPNIVKFGVNEQLLIPLQDLIEENMPHYKKAIEELPGIIGRTTETDGNIYALSTINQCYHCMYAQKMWVNTKWLDEIGLGVPKTTEEFKAVLEKYMEINPDGIGLVGSSNGWYQDFTDFIINSFIFSPGYGWVNRIVTTPESTIDTIANKEEYRDALRYLNELYELGAIYEGSFTQTSDQVKSLVLEDGEPVLFAASGTVSEFVDATAHPEIYRNYAAIEPLEGPTGLKQCMFLRFSGIGSGSFVVTEDCEYPEAAVRWADFFYSPEGDLTAQYGMEGVDWRFEPKDMYGLNGLPALYEVLTPYSSEPQNNDWQDLGIRYAPNDYRLGQAIDLDVDPYAPEGLELLLYNVTKEMYEPYGQSKDGYDVVPTTKFTAEENSAISTISVELENYIKEHKVAFILGTKSLDKDWDAYVKGFDGIGLPTYLETYTTAYQRQYGDTRQ